MDRSSSVPTVTVKNDLPKRVEVKVNCLRSFPTLVKADANGQLKALSSHCQKS